MTNKNDFAEIEISIASANEAIQMMESYIRLRKNKDFKKLIEEFYFSKRACQLVLLRGDLNVPEENRDNILKEIDAIGMFRSFLNEIVGYGNMAKDKIKEYESTRNEILDEEV